MTRINKSEQIQDRHLEHLIKKIQTTRNIDFSGYKRSSLTRRIERRLEALNLKSYAEYEDYLTAQPSEYNHLLDSLLINVSAFFRDSKTWDIMKNEVLPKIIANVEQEVIRVWCVGCATGEEAYTLAILFAEHMGEKVFKKRLKIYATDVDAGALQAARAAQYTQKSAENLPPDLLKRYFLQHDDQYVFRKDLRKSIIFGEHNIISDVPISKLDLITCRNLLIYLNADAQRQVLKRFYYALNPKGHLLLGKAETLLMNSDSFKPVRLHERIFEKCPGIEDEGRIMGPHRPINNSSLLSALLNSIDIGVVMLDEVSIVKVINTKAQFYFGLQQSDIGKDFKDLKLSYEPVELRSKLKKVMQEKQPLYERESRHKIASTREVVYLDVVIYPKLSSNGSVNNIILYFIDKTKEHQLRVENIEVNKRLVVLTEDLQSANDELETTNEELQSTNEELETTNEELQSTNEELETTNEEMQASNEELEASNERLKKNGEILDRYRTLTETMLNGIDLGVVSIDGDNRINRWNHWNEQQWGLQQDEVLEKNIFDIEVGIDFSGLRKQIVTREKVKSKLEISARNRLGEDIDCELTIYPIFGSDENFIGFVIIIANITENKQLEKKLVKSMEEYNHLSRIYTVGELVSEIAHEIGQPLASINSLIAGLEIKLKKDDKALSEYDEILLRIGKFSEQATKVINNVRGLSRKQPSIYSWIKVRNLINDAIEFFTRLINERKVELTVFIDPDLEAVFIDTVQINQVLINLIKNALDAISEYPQNLRHIIIRVQRFEDGRFSIYLENTGPQFSQEEIEKMFESYYTTKKSGVGLGLSIARSILESNHGQLLARPRESGGVCFEVRLPEISK